MAPAQKTCKNDSQYTYTGREQSPLGLGIAPQPEKVGSVMTGRDGNKWMVICKSGENMWTKVPNGDMVKEAPVMRAEEEEAAPVAVAVAEAEAAVVTPKVAEPEVEVVVPPPAVKKVRASKKVDVVATDEVVEKVKKPRAKKVIAEAEKVGEGESVPVPVPVPEKKKAAPKKTVAAAVEGLPVEGVPVEGVPVIEKKKKAAPKKKAVALSDGVATIPTEAAEPKKKRAPTKYNIFIGEAIGRLRASNPGLPAGDYMKMAAAEYKLINVKEVKE